MSMPAILFTARPAAVSAACALTILLALCCAFPQLAQAQNIREAQGEPENSAEQIALEIPSPHAGEMVIDLLLVRPLTLSLTAIGAAFFVVALPFSLPGGNMAQTAETLVVTPFNATFRRCLGCTTPDLLRQQEAELGSSGN